jgi:type I restriction enzyme S subunit
MIKEFANGANVLHLKPELITKQRIVIPQRELQDEFALKVHPLYTQVDLISEAITRLTALRQIFLPRLISGKLSVDDLDIQFPPSMQEELNSE